MWGAPGGAEPRNPRLATGWGPWGQSRLLSEPQSPHSRVCVGPGTPHPPPQADGGHTRRGTHRPPRLGGGAWPGWGGAQERARWRAPGITLACPNPLTCSPRHLLPGTTRQLGPTGAIQAAPMSLPGPPKINSPWDFAPGDISLFTHPADRAHHPLSPRGPKTHGEPQSPPARREGSGLVSAKPAMGQDQEAWPPADSGPKPTLSGPHSGAAPSAASQDRAAWAGQGVARGPPLRGGGGPANDSDELRFVSAVRTPSASPGPQDAASAL